MENNKFDWPIIGHKNVVDYLQRSIINKKIAHSYIFLGNNGLGKKLTAECFIATLICANKEENGKKPCGKCEFCRQIMAKIYPDLYYVNIAKNEKTKKLSKEIKIDQIRLMREKLSRRSFLNSYKAAMIEDADKMSKEAANSLLKTLEEPSPKTTIILIAQSKSQLLSTIKSRCQIIRFFPVADKIIFDHLMDLGADRKQAANYSNLATGMPGVAIDFFRDKEKFDDYQRLVNYLLSLLKGKITQRFETVNEFLEAGSNDFNEQVIYVRNGISIWKSLVRDMILIKYFQKNWVKNMFALSDIEKLSEKHSLIELKKIIKNLEESVKYLQLNVNPRLVLENLVINF